MAVIISLHSFRRGTGKSNLIASLAVLLARGGKRIGVVDTDFQSPSLSLLFGVEEKAGAHTLNDYLWAKCNLHEAIYDVTPSAASIKGKVFIVPSSSKPGEIARVLRRGYNINLLNAAFNAFVERCRLDILLIDNHAGLNEETLISMAIADILLVVMRPDQQDYQGTAVMMEIAKQLKVPRAVLLVNEVPGRFDLAEVKKRMEETYQCQVLAALPHSEEMITLASSGIFALRYPEDSLTRSLKQVADKLLT